MAVHFRFLFLDGYQVISNEDLKFIVDGCRELRVLSIASCTFVSDAGLMHISESKNLEALCLRGLIFSDAGLMAIVDGCQKLRFLDVGDNRRSEVSDQVPHFCLHTFRITAEFAILARHLVALCMIRLLG